MTEPFPRSSERSDWRTTKHWLRNTERKNKMTIQMTFRKLPSASRKRSSREYHAREGRLPKHAGWRRMHRRLKNWKQPGRSVSERAAMGDRP